MATQVTLNSGSVDTASSLAIKTNGTTTSTTFDASQNVILGTSGTSYPSVASVTAFTPRLQIQGTTLGTSGFGQYAWNTNPYFTFNRSLGAIGVYTKIGSSSSIGNIQFNGADDTSFVGSSAIRGQSDGTVSTGVVPGALAFFTASSAGSLTERVRVDSSGNVGIGTTSPTNLLDVAKDQASGTTLRVNNSLSDAAAYSNVNVTSNAGGVYLIANSTTFSTTGLLGGSSGGAVVSDSGLTNGMAVGTQAGPLKFFAGSTSTERGRFDASGNAYIESGTLWQYAPAPTSLSAGANTPTAAQLQGDLFTAAASTSVTMTLPTGTALDTYFTGVPTTNIGFDFHVINTGSSTGAVTVAGNTGVTTVGSMTVAITTSAHFRLRRTAANTYIVYRLS